MTDTSDHESKIRLSASIKEAGAGLDFDIVKIAPAVSPTGFHPLLDWISKGYAADMDWIKRRADAYKHPDGVMPNTRSVVIVALNYANESPPETDARISRYAWGTSDYHKVLKKRLKALGKVIYGICPEAQCRAAVDTAPLLERDFARVAGIGWYGKNTMLISREIGSWFFLGAILTSVELEYDQPFESDYCGSCTRCLDACPTDAFPEPGVLDANRCISYLTIERRDKPIATELKFGMGNWIFGCDICQEVCPWNRFAPQDSLPEFHRRTEMASLCLDDVLNLDEDTFAQTFTGTPLKRTGRNAIVRNAAIAAGNQPEAASLQSLAKLLDDPDSMVRDAASWAVAQIQSHDRSAD